MVIGRGYYQIKDCRDGTTEVSGIDGVSVSIYDPDVSIEWNSNISSWRGFHRATIICNQIKRNQWPNSAPK